LQCVLCLLLMAEDLTEIIVKRVTDVNIAWFSELFGRRLSRLRIKLERQGDSNGALARLVQAESILRKT